MPDLLTLLHAETPHAVSRWERDEASMSTAIARRDALLRAAIADHGGVPAQAIGDAVCATFASPQGAVAAALDAQRVTRAEPWGESGPLGLRIALVTGPAADDGGAPVPLRNRAARLVAVGHAGQILLARRASGLVADGLPPELTLRDLGERHLPGLDGPEHVFLLVAPDLPAHFPPLDTVDRRPHNLPVGLTPLLGREPDLARVEALLRRDGVRLVTVTGPGGVGKTRLALEAALGLVDEQADGARFVDLAPTTEPALVLAVIAAALGVQETGEQPLHETLIAHLTPRQLLLVLDNLEQVVAGAPRVSELLAACPHLKVLATSRGVLHLSGEWECRLEPLPLLDPARLPPLEALRENPAVRLFVAAAAASSQGFTLTAGNAAAVAAICRRLDGLPLAIELAAAHAKVLSPQGLLARLEKGLALPRPLARDRPVRQQTLRGAIAWSVDLLRPEEQTFFRRFAVFASGGALDAVESVCADGGRAGTTAEDALSELVEASLVRRTEQADGSPRFSMLETIREVAAEQLAGSGEEPAVRHAHAACYLALAEAAAWALAGPTQGRWLDRLEAEHDNLRAALGWACALAEAGTALQLAAALAPFWETRGHLTEGRAWLDRALATEGEPDAPARARALDAAGELAERQGDVWAAAARHEAALVAWRRLGDQAGTARALDNLGVIALHQADYGLAASLLEEALALYQGLDDRRGTAGVLVNLGDLASLRGELARAAEHYDRALPLLRELGDRRGVGAVLHKRGALALELGEVDHAATLLGEGLALMREVGDRRTAASALAGLGRVLLARGELARAGACFEEALGVFEALGDRPAAATMLARLGRLAVEQGDEARAAGLFRRSLSRFDELGDREGVATCLEGLAAAPAARGGARAARLLGAAEALRELIASPLARTDQAPHDRAVAAAQSRQAWSAFTADWEAGRALSLEEAVAEALAVTGDA